MNVIKNHIEYSHLTTVLLILLTISVQLLVLSKVEKYSLFIIVGINTFLVSLVIQKLFFRNSTLYLFLLASIPLLYIDNGFHYTFSYTFILNIPLILILLYSFFEITKNFNLNYKHFSPLLKSVVYVVTFAIIGAVIGFLHGYEILPIFIETYNYLYFIFAIIFYYLLKERKDYQTIITMLIVIFSLISIEHILLYFITGGERTVSYQSNFTPFIIGIIFSYILYSKKSEMKFGAILLLILVITGEFLTLTRGLWVATFLAVGGSYLFYLKYEKNLNTKFLISIFTIVLLGAVFMQKDQKLEVSATSEEYHDVDYRSQSILNPTSDTSFLMRIEFGYYTIVEFLSSPIWGKGIGDQLKYKVFVSTNQPKSYPDQSWLYILWKQGIIGFILFFLMFFRFSKLVLFLFKRTDDPYVKIICLGIIGGIVATLFNSMLTSVLIKYKLNVIFAFLFAYIEFEYQAHKKLLENK